MTDRQRAMEEAVRLVATGRRSGVSRLEDRMTWLRKLADVLLACTHSRLGIKVTRRGERYCRTCMSCARLVEIPLTDLLEIKPPVRTQDAKPAQAEEPTPTGLERRWLSGMGVRG